MMADVPPVEKLGSLWRGRVIFVTPSGDLVTNFVHAELLPLSRHAKIWFDVPLEAGTVRGLIPAGDSPEKGRIGAVAGESGFVELRLGGGSAAALTGLCAGDGITASFRT